MTSAAKTVATLAVAGVVVAGFMMANQQGAATAEPLQAAPLSLAQAAALAQSAAASPATAAHKKLLFFMNPDGYPCQQQLSILAGVADSLAKVAQVVYVKTTVPADMRQFEAYGIRALPSLVITDGDGRELSRFAPGIQSGERVLAALTK